MDLFRTKIGLIIAMFVPFIGIPMLLFANWEKIVGVLSNVLDKIRDKFNVVFSFVS